MISHEPKAGVNSSDITKLDQPASENQSPIVSVSFQPIQGSFTSAEPSDINQLRRAQSSWNRLEQIAGAIIDGLGLPIEEKIISVVVGLNALQLTTSMSCEGHIDSEGSDLKRENIPWVFMGDGGGVLPMRYEGQKAEFDKDLQEIKVPLTVRLKNFQILGFKTLTSDIVRRIDSPDFRFNHMSFWQKIYQAYEGSMARMQEGFIAAASKDISWSPPFTPVERERREQNSQIFKKLSTLLDEFNSTRNDPDSIRAQILSDHLNNHASGSEFLLVFGINATGQEKNQELLTRRQAIAKEFGDFLKNKFFFKFSDPTHK